MTREEILNTPEIVDFMIDKSVMVDSKMKLHKRLDELCKLAIKALEQEPCDDCISRQAVIDALCDTCELYHRNGEQTCLSKCESYHFLATLPSVNPQEDILDKIRAEIMSKDGLEEALEIIDKYKTESEE